MPSPSDQLAELQRENAELKQANAELKQANAELKQRSAHRDALCREQQETIGQLQSQLETMSEQIVLLKKALFGRRRERYAPSPDQQLLFSPELLDDPELLDEDNGQQNNEDKAGADQDASESAPADQRRRRKRKRFEFPECLAVKRIEHPLSEEELACPCGCGNRMVIREHVSRQLELIQADAHSAYDALVRESQGRLLELGCWAHGRRGFDQACAVSSHIVAHEALAWIQQLYDLEDQLADRSVEERYGMRQQEAVPILARLEERLREVEPTLRPSSKLCQAIHYVLNRWPAMTRYTEDGRYPIDNNLIERLLRPAVVGRKNYLFFGSDDGGDAAAIWYTIIQSARHNLVDILPYLTDVLKRLPTIVPEYLPRGSSSPFASLADDQLSALGHLLPDRWLRDHPEHLLADRADELATATTRRRRRRAARRATVKA